MKAAISHSPLSFVIPAPSRRVNVRSDTFRAAFLAASSVVALGLVMPAAHAQNATWTGAGNDGGQFTNAANWNPNTAVPTGTAMFATATPTTITQSGTTIVGALQFNAGAAAYTINNRALFGINNAGIVNLSSNMQTITNGNQQLLFTNSASAGNNNLVTITNAAAGQINFNLTSTGGSANINNATNGGTINFADMSSAGSANISNSGSLNFTLTSTAGSASITNNGTGLVQFTGNADGGTAAFTNNANGNIDFSASKGANSNGKLLVGSISGAGNVFLGANQLTIGGNNQSTTISGVINDGSVGTPGGKTGGSLVKTGTGTLTLSGANLYTGTTMVMAGVLNVTGSITSDTTVTGGALAGSGTIQSLTAQSGGTVAPGMVTPFSTLNVTGTASFVTGSTFVVNINSAGQNDKLVVGGTATINGGTVSVLGGTGITATSTFTILSAKSVTGSGFANVTSNLAFLTPTLTQNATSVVLSVTPKSPPTPVTPKPVTFASVATTPNQIATANAVQALGKGPVFNAVIGQSVAGAQQAFTALSGEVHASTVNAAFTDATLPNTAILDHLNQPVAPPVLGAAIETTGAYAADLPTRKGPVAPVSASFYQPRIFDLWGQGFGDWGRVSSDGNAASLSRTTGGFVIGGDVSATNFMGGDWRFGLAGGYTNDQITVNQRGSSSTFESVFGGAYAGASFGAFQLRAGALYGTNNTSTTRQVIFPGFFEALSSSNGGYTAQAFGEAGYRIQLGGLGFGAGSRAFVEPFAGGAAFLIHQNGFTEVGGTSALTATARDFNIQTTTLGVRGELAFASMPLTLKTMVGWRHAYGDVVPSVLLTFQGGAQAFSTSGVPIDRDAFVAEAGIDYSITSMLSVGVSYSGQYGQRATDNAVKGNVNLRF